MFVCFDMANGTLMKSCPSSVLSFSMASLWTLQLMVSSSSSSRQGFLADGSYRNRGVARHVCGELPVQVRFESQHNSTTEQGRIEK